jgi:Rad3-related DNA helicase
LVHASSYTKAFQIAEKLNNPRVITHTSEDFREKMEQFLKIPDAVLISPSCYEGVDLHDDKCRFNVLTSLPYPSAGDPYFKRVLENGRWDLYNVTCMRQIGQALGRGVRHKEDWCKNYLLDSRFTPFLRKMAKVLPGWLKESFVLNNT